MDPKADLLDVKKRKFDPTETRTPTPVVQPIASRCNEYVIPATYLRVEGRVFNTYFEDVPTLVDRGCLVVSATDPHGC
jgi:hypothetical protein